ncbi:TauD/TfdA family dioxygenase [Streptomyces malaysiensis subsp. malaysiensis]
MLDARGGPDPAGRAAAHRGAARAALAESGAVMLRGLGVRTPGDVADVAAALGIAAMTEREGFAPRTAHAPGVYSGSHWPADEPMCMHHELSYAATVPGTLIFGCLTAPGSGGRTTVADSQRVLAALPPGLVAPFERHGWLLRRMYHDVGVAWADAFGTTDRSAVDAYCAAAGIEHAWLSDDRLATRQRRTAVVRHPRTGAPGWFNQVAFLNGLTMDPAVRDYLTDVYGPDGLPFDTSAGDGTPSPPPRWTASTPSTTGSPSASRGRRATSSSWTTSAPPTPANRTKGGATSPSSWATPPNCPAMCCR